jgi:hypothetical protein
MFADPRTPESGRPQHSSVRVAYADNLLRVAAVLAGLGLLLLALSLLSQQISIGARAVAVGDLGVAAIAALLGFGWRWRRRRSAL